MKRISSFKGLVVFLAAFAVIVSLTFGVIADETIVYHGNTKSKVFHRPGCLYYDCKNCTTQFFSRQEAIDAGYRPCKVCSL